MATLFERLSGNLLDLGLRNKLLNFKDQKLRSIEIVEPDSDELFSLVTNDRILYFIEPVEEEQEDEGLVVSNNSDVVRRENEIIAYKRNEKYDYILKHLKKFNDSAIVEKGINILYVAFGMLNWKETNFSKGDLKAPLLLVPVNLDYDKSKQAYSIRRIDEEVVVNPSLKAKIDMDFEVLLPDFVPEEDDVESYLSKVEDILPEDDWFVDNKTYLGIFSFAKLTMYNDLKEHEQQMSSSSLVKAIYNGDDSGIDHYFDTDYDDFFKNSKDVKLYNVVDADSSQIEAILEAKKGKSFVIQGPPGTGKSQTITNIIAELLNDDKKVLFVSEKKAALDVVFNNLKKVGLGDFCFQVHSDKMNKRDFVTELYRVLSDTKYRGVTRDALLRNVSDSKKELDAYCNVLYKTINPLGIRVFDILNACYLYKKYDNLDYRIPDIKSKSLGYLSECKNALEKYSLFDISVDFHKSPWFGFNPESYNYQNDSYIKSELEESTKFLKQILEKTSYLTECIGEEFNTLDSIEGRIFDLMYFVELPYRDPDLLNKNKRKKIISRLEELEKVYKLINESKKKGLSVFKESIFDLDVEDYKDRFVNDYKSFFRIFNASYRSDRNELKEYLNDDIKKPSYSILCRGLRNASIFNRQNSVLKRMLDDTKSFISFDYDLYSPEGVGSTLAKIRQFDSKYSNVDFVVKEGTDLSKLSESIYALSVTTTQENIEKCQSAMNLFMKEYVDLSNKSISFIADKFDNCVSNIDSLIEWVRFCIVWLPIEKLGLSSFTSYAMNNGVKKEDLSNAYSYCFYHGWMMIVYYENNELKYFRRNLQDRTVDQFKNYDKELLKLDRLEIASKISNKLYSYRYGTLNNLSGDAYRNRYEIKREISILEHEANKRRAIKPIRVMFREIPHLLYKIKPCLLMSPLSVATYLTYYPDSFDVAIFDEASQIFPWDAIGAISRSKSTIVVGDSKQMPPTNFFMAGTGNDDEYDEEEEEDVTDYESILDLCTAVLPQKMLNWHYRSKTESLIAFSNRNFYRNRLVTFPSSQNDSDDFGIKFYYVKNGVFNNRQNVKEAEAVVDLVFKHFKKHPERSLGVVCFSINQQALLEDIIDERRRRSDPYAKFFDQNIAEPFFIKNLETVQGDERDTIIFSIGYGKDAAGNLKHNFGPLNRKGGERRLNVAITRAKYNVQVVSSIRSFDIDLNRTRAEGARLLKEYLDLAENGLKVLNKDLIEDPNAKADSAFEEDVAEVIRQAGFKVDLQVGCSGYRIDICVKHPKNNDYVLAVECDGRTYHSAKNARDRDRLRQEVLERLGWKFYRIWSTDWFINRSAEIKSLLERVNKAVLDYDIAAKEIEERNRITVEERYKAVDLLNDEKQENIQESEKGSFLDLLNPEQKEYMNAFNKELDDSPYKFVMEDREYSFAYKLQSDLDQGKKRAWFWIMKNGSKLIFKIKDDASDTEPSKQFPIGKQGGASALADLVLQLCSKKQRAISENIDDSFEDETEDEEPHKDVEKYIKNERFYFLIARAIQGRKVYSRNSNESNVISEVVDFVMNEISHDVISKGYFKNKEEFDQFKYHRRYTYSFFGLTFSLGNISSSKAGDIYCYFVAAKVIDKIKTYEKMFKTTIIGDQKAFATSLYRMIKEEEIVFSKCNGLTSDFALVPESVLEEEVNKYLSI